MSKFIVITSINKPSAGIKKFAGFKDYTIVVVGDKKTPLPWSADGVIYLSVEEQSKLGYKFSNSLPYNHYCRKMIGYLYAIKHGATEIVDTDDDNLPYNDWSFPEFASIQKKTPPNMGFQNIYEYYTPQKIWPRGYPLELVNKPSVGLKNLEESATSVGIWQGLADDDPDVDAIYRLTVGTPCFFDKNAPVVLDKGTVCPFNSQNTIFSKESFPLLYLPCFVTFRFTDILRGFIAQPIMWNADLLLGFTNASVYQERNPHDYLKDFESEIPCFLFAQKVIDITTSAVVSNYSISENLISVYKALSDHKIVTLEEVKIAEKWIHEF